MVDALQDFSMKRQLTVVLLEACRRSSPVCIGPLHGLHYTRNAGLMPQPAGIGLVESTV